MSNLNENHVTDAFSRTGPAALQELLLKMVDEITAAHRRINEVDTWIRQSAQLIEHMSETAPETFNALSSAVSNMVDEIESMKGANVAEATPAITPAAEQAAETATQ